MRTPDKPTKEQVADSQRCKLKPDDRNCSSKQSGYKLPAVYRRIKFGTNLLGFVTSICLILVLQGISKKIGLVTLIFVLMFISAVLTIVQLSVSSSSRFLAVVSNLDVILKGLSIALSYSLDPGDQKSSLLVVPTMSMFVSLHTSCIAEIARGVILVAFLFQPVDSKETYAIVAISYLDGIFYLITYAIFYPRPTKSEESVGFGHSTVSVNGADSVYGQTREEPNNKIELQEYVQSPLLMSSDRHRDNLALSARLPISDGITHGTRTKTVRKRNSTVSKRYMSGRRSRILVQVELARRSRGNSSKPDTVHSLRSKVRRSTHLARTNLELESRTAFQQDYAEPQELIEAKYLDMISQIILASDDSLSVIYNNYHERFYPTILKKMASSINIEKFRTKYSGTLEDFFKTKVDQPVETDELTIQLMLSMLAITGVNLADQESLDGLDDPVKTLFLTLTKLNTHLRRKQGTVMGRSNLQKSRIRDAHALELIQIQAEIQDIIRFIRWFFVSSSIESHNFQFPIVLRFYLHTCIQVQFSIILEKGEYLLFTTFESIEDKVALGETNNKLNYSYLLLCSLSHELLTPLNQLMLISEQMSDKLGSLFQSKQAVDVSNTFSMHLASPPLPPRSPRGPGRKIETEKLVEDSAHINLMARGLSLTVQNFLDFAKYIIRTLKVVPRPLDLNRVVADTVRIVQLKLQKKGLSVKVDVQCDAQMVSDEDKLTGLLYTFLDNAVKYTQHGGVSLTVRNGHTADHLRFEVADTGIGIDEEDMFKISSILENPFVDLKTRYSAGIGIGLRVAQVLIMYLSGGDIELNVSSLKGHGTTISFEILRHAKELKDGFFQQLDKQSGGPTSKKSEELNYGMRGVTRKFSKRGFTLNKESPTPEELIQEVVITEQSPIPSPINGRFGTIGHSGIQEHDLDESPRSVQKHRSPRARMYSKRNSQGTVMSSMKSSKRPNLVTTSIVIKTIPHAQSTNRFPQTLHNSNSKASNPTLEQIEVKIEDAASNPSNTDSLEAANKIDLFAEQKLSYIRKTALVVDDEVLNCELIQDVLEDYELEVFTAYDGESALEQCLKFLTFNKKLDIIFMDYSMPLMNGDVCAQTLRSSKFDPILKDTPIVGLTAHRDDQIANKCLAAGMTMIEYKPITNHKLTMILQKYQMIHLDMGDFRSLPDLSRQAEECMEDIADESPLSLDFGILTTKIRHFPFHEMQTKFLPQRQEP